MDIRKTPSGGIPPQLNWQLKYGNEPLVTMTNVCCWEILAGLVILRNWTKSC
jgi:hypothetical protein